MVYIVMGVSGCGKSAVGRLLGERLGLVFYDGDDFHPEANRRKMQAGQALDDEDRQPWLDMLAGRIAEWNRAGGAVLACSALKRDYRYILARDGGVRFIYLRGGRDVIARRLSERENHFFDPGLLDSQFAILEEPDDALVVDIAKPVAQIVDTLVQAISLTESD